METEHKHIRELERVEIERILRESSYAHLGCHDRGETFIFPITYVYEDGSLLCHSLMGKKMEMMRRNPKVCLQVEEVHSLFNWKSVIVWGRFEELTDGPDAEVALRLLKKKISAMEAKRKISQLEVDLDAILSNAKIYRINIEKMAGRAEEMR